jgi:hypothetical protein
MQPLILIVLLFILIVSIWYFTSALTYRKQLQLENFIEQNFPIGEERLFQGRLIHHWEKGRFEWCPNPQQRKKYNLSFPCQLVVFKERRQSNFQLSSQGEGIFDLEFRGKLMSKGYFGRRSMYRYRIEVIEVLTLKPVSGQVVI